MTETINTIKQKLKQITNKSDRYLLAVAKDPRKGAQQALLAWRKQYDKTIAKEKAFLARFNYEQTQKLNGYQMIAGVDEVGRGPLAGPVVAAAVILSDDFNLQDVIDSKQLTDVQRRHLVDQIKVQSIAYAVSVVDVAVIDEINIYEAARLAMKQAVQNLDVPADYLLIDAMQVDLPIAQSSIIKGDAKSNSIAAASILAKVYRDDLMKSYAQIYPAYDFDHNAGYGTAKHLAALKMHGITPIHRRSFQPIKTLGKKG